MCDCLKPVAWVGRGRACGLTLQPAACRGGGCTKSTHIHNCADAAVNATPLASLSTIALCRFSCPGAANNVKPPCTPLCKAASSIYDITSGNRVYVVIVLHHSVAPMFMQWPHACVFHSPDQLSAHALLVPQTNVWLLLGLARIDSKSNLIAGAIISNMPETSAG